MVTSFKKFFNINTLIGLLIGGSLSFLYNKYYDVVSTDGLTTNYVLPGGQCTMDSRIYLDWNQNYDPSNSYATKVTDDDYIEASRNYNSSLTSPILDGSFGGTIDIKFLSGFICQAISEGATSVSFNIAKGKDEGPKVHLFSDARAGITNQVMTFARVSGCPPNCRDRDTMTLPMPDGWEDRR